MTAPQRLASVDALRGLTVAAMLLVNNPGDWGAVYWPLEHAAWNGCTPTDLIFPFFLLIAGVSLSLATGGRWSRSEPAAALLPPLLKRAAKVILLGLVLHVLAWWLMDKPHFRLMGVLQRIGLCLALAALLGTLCRREAGRWVALGALLLGYGALMTLNGGWVPSSNLASRLDAQLLGRWSLQWDATTGLWTGGWAFAALALTYELVDRRGLPPLGRIFGVNAIAAYAGAWMCTVFLEGFGWMGPLYRTVFAPIGSAFGPEFQSLSFACVFVLVWTGLVWLMDRQRWYIKL